MKIHSPTEIFEDDVRGWRMQILCLCKRKIDVWFFSYPGDYEVEIKAIHNKDVDVLRSSELNMRHVLRVIGNVLGTMECGVPWDLATHTALLEVEL
jgi:hypothetical protein